jgi:Co/Zn/Cd efflux system component
MPLSTPRRNSPMTSNLRRTVAIVAALNLAYFGVEFAVARAIGSVSLYADSIDFLEDASVNTLILLSLGFAAKARRLVGFGLAALLLVPSIAAVWTAWEKLQNPAVADPYQLSLTAFGALAVNTICALLLARVRDHAGSLSKAAFLSARNDMAANIAMIAAAIITLLTPSIWPDLLVGLGIAALNANAAWEVYEAAVSESGDEKKVSPHA